MAELCQRCGNPTSELADYGCTRDACSCRCHQFPNCRCGVRVRSTMAITQAPPVGEWIKLEPVPLGPINRIRCAWGKLVGNLQYWWITRHER